MTESSIDNKNLKIIQGYYGSGNTACNIFVYTNERRGYAYYCIEGGVNLNKTHDVEALVLGVDTQTINDIDTSKLQKEVKNLWQFKRRILE